MEAKKIAYGLYALGLMPPYSGSKLYAGVLESKTKVIGIKDFQNPPTPISCCEEYTIGFGCGDKGLYIATVEPVRSTSDHRGLIPEWLHGYKLHLYSDFKLIASDTGVIDMILYSNINESEDIQFTSTAFGVEFFNMGYSEEEKEKKKIKVYKFIEDNLKILYNPSQCHLYNELYSIYDFHYYTDRIFKKYPEIGKIFQFAKDNHKQFVEEFIKEIQRGV